MRFLWMVLFVSSGFLATAQADELDVKQGENEVPEAIENNLVKEVVGIRREQAESCTIRVVLAEEAASVSVAMINYPGSTFRDMPLDTETDEGFSYTTPENGFILTEGIKRRIAVENDEGQYAIHTVAFTKNQDDQFVGKVIKVEAAESLEETPDAPPSVSRRYGYRAPTGVQPGRFHYGTGGNFRDGYDFVRRHIPYQGPIVAYSLREAKPGNVLQMSDFRWAGNRGSRQWAIVEGVDAAGNMTFVCSNVNGDRSTVRRTVPLQAFFGKVVVYQGDAR